jgi:hypothetical protein
LEEGLDDLELAAACDLVMDVFAQCEVQGAQAERGEDQRSVDQGE